MEIFIQKPLVVKKSSLFLGMQNDALMHRVKRFVREYGSYKLRYIVGFGLVEMAISTNPKPKIYRNLCENMNYIAVNMISSSLTCLTCLIIEHLKVRLFNIWLNINHVKHSSNFTCLLAISTNSKPTIYSIS